MEKTIEELKAEIKHLEATVDRLEDEMDNHSYDCMDCNHPAEDVLLKWNKEIRDFTDKLANHQDAMKEDRSLRTVTLYQDEIEDMINVLRELVNSL